MTDEIAVANQQNVPAVDMAVVTEYLDSTGLTKSLLPKEKAMFVQMCKGYGLNPFKREIYCTAYGEGQYRKCSIVTGFEVYLKRAERTGKLNGWHVTSSGSVATGDLTATVTILRKDWAEPFTHTVLYSECVQTTKDGRPNAVWAKQPSYMTKKVAMGQGFRLCFPDELGGMPYTNDEVGVDAAPMVERNVTPVQQSIPTPAQSAPVPPVPPAPPVQQEQPKPVSQVRLDLEALRDEYDLQLKGEPYKMVTDLLNKQAATDAEYSAMITRVKTYLNRKGVRVV